MNPEYSEHCANLTGRKHENYWFIVYFDNFLSLKKAMESVSTVYSLYLFTVTKLFVSSKRAYVIFVPEISWTRQIFFPAAIEMACNFLCFVFSSAVSCEFLFRCNFLVATWIYSKKIELHFKAKKTKLYKWQRRKGSC